VQCLWRCYAADPRSQFSATWYVHARHQAGHFAAGHNFVRSFSRVARRASVSLVRFTRTSRNSCSPDGTSSAFPAAAAAGQTDKRTGEIADDLSGLLLTDEAAAAARLGLLSTITAHHHHHHYHLSSLMLEAAIKQRHILVRETETQRCLALKVQGSRGTYVGLISFGAKAFHEISVPQVHARLTVSLTE